MLSWSREIYPFNQAPSGSAMRGLHVRRKVLPSRTIAAEPRGDARATTGLCAFGVRRTKVLREKVHCRSLSSIHMDYNQPLVGGPSVHPTPAMQIGNLQLTGGSIGKRSAHQSELYVTLLYVTFYVTLLCPPRRGSNGLPVAPTHAL